MIDNLFQDVYRSATGVDGARTQPGGQGKPRNAIEGEQREVLMLIEIAVKPGQDLLPMGRIVRRIQVNDDRGGHGAARPGEQFGQVLVEDLEALAEGGVHLAEHWPFLYRQLRLPPRERLVEAIESRATG